MSLAIDFTLASIGVTLFEGFNFRGLLSLPLFILTGDLIAAADIARRLAEFAHACLSWMRGGLGLATIGSCGLFAAISGSNSATTATIGGIMHPLPVRNGYDSRFAAAMAAAGGTVGIIIPPSIIFIVYGFLMNLSISGLSVAGILPGMLMVVAMQVVCWWMCLKHGWGSISPLDVGRVVRSAGSAYPGFFAIFIVIFGIYSCIFSPTEAAAITVGFCLIAVSIVMQQVFALLGAAETVQCFIAWFGSGDVVALLACMGIVLAAGTILESLPVTVIFAPILAPIAVAADVDPVHSR